SGPAGSTLAWPGEVSAVEARAEPVKFVASRGERRRHSATDRVAVAPHKSGLPSATNERDGGRRTELACSEPPECSECGIDVPPKAQRVEGLIKRGEFALTKWRQRARGQQALKRRLGAIVAARHASAVARLRHEPLHGLKEIRVQPQQAIHAGQLRVRGARDIAVVAHERPDDRTILLLDVGAVVLAVRPTAGERDPLETA